VTSRGGGGNSTRKSLNTPVYIKTSLYSWEKNTNASHCCRDTLRRTFIWKRSLK
jgi:hypothetical protein